MARKCCQSVHRERRTDSPAHAQSGPSPQCSRTCMLSGLSPAARVAGRIVNVGHLGWTLTEPPRVPTAFARPTHRRLTPRGMSLDEVTCAFLDGRYVAVVDALSGAATLDSPALRRLRCDALLATDSQPEVALEDAQALVSGEPGVLAHHARRGCVHRDRSSARAAEPCCAGEPCSRLVNLRVRWTLSST
jgi:hypothetical protein